MLIYSLLKLLSTDPSTISYLKYDHKNVLYSTQIKLRRRYLNSSRAHFYKKTIEEEVERVFLFYEGYLQFGKSQLFLVKTSALRVKEVKELGFLTTSDTELGIPQGAYVGPLRFIQNIYILVDICFVLANNLNMQSCQVYAEEGKYF